MYMFTAHVVLMLNLILSKDKTVVFLFELIFSFLAFRHVASKWSKELKRTDLDDLPWNGVQVIIAEVQFFQCQQVVERSLVDQNQLVVVQDQVVKLRHSNECIVPYSCQTITVRH